jgi:predicted MFS family arabinose efflux permease
VNHVLKLPAFRRLFAAYTLNELAWSFGSLALALLVYRHTGSALGATAFFLCAQFIPALISPALVARLDQRMPRRVLPALYGLEAVAFALLAWVASRFALAPVLLLTTADGILALTARSIARATTVAVTAPPRLLREGNALTNAAFSICFMVGPAVGGIVVAAGGISEALIVNSGLFAVIALTLLGARGLPDAVSEQAPTARRLRAALRYARERAAIRTLLSIQASALVFFTISIPVEVVLAQHTLRAGARGYGALLAAWGAGAIAGSAVYARWRRLEPRALIAGAAASLGLGFVVMAAAPTIAVAVAGAALGGAGNGVEAVAARTTLQEHVEQSWMALMMSLNESISQSMPGAGIVIGGSITALWSPRAALALGGAGALLVAMGAWRWLRPVIRSPISEYATDPIA